MNRYHYIDDQGNISDALPLAALHKIGLPPATKVLLEGGNQWTTLERVAQDDPACQAAGSATISDTSRHRPTPAGSGGPRWTRPRAWLPPLLLLLLLLCLFNAPAFVFDHYCEYAISGSKPHPRGCHVGELGPASFHWRYETGLFDDENRDTFLKLLHAPALGVGIHNKSPDSRPDLTHYYLIFLPISGIAVFVLCSAGWFVIVSKRKDPITGAAVPAALSVSR